MPNPMANIPILTIRRSVIGTEDNERFAALLEGGKQWRQLAIDISECGLLGRRTVFCCAIDKNAVGLMERRYIDKQEDVDRSVARRAVELPVQLGGGSIRPK